MPQDTLTKTDYLNGMLNWLESEGFHLYYDEKSREWELMSTESEYALIGADKERIIQEAYHYLAH